MKKAIALPVALGMLAIVAGIAGQSNAAESGTGLYVGGTQAFGSGATPSPGFYFTVGSLFYDGDVNAVVGDGVVNVNARKTVIGFLGNALYVFEGGIVGGRLGISASLPFAQNTRLRASASGAVVGSMETDGWGIGDLSLKFQNGWTHGEFSHTASVTVWLPTGRYDTGFSPNSGKNHVGFDFGWAFTQVWKDPSIELSVALGYSVELENRRTNYRNGDTFHADFAAGYRAPGGWTLGAAGYAIQQVTGDSGSGATLGGFKRRTFALGPALSYSGLIGGKAVSISARHYREFGARNTFEGHISFVTVTVKF